MKQNNLLSEQEKLRETIAALRAQRVILGDTVVDAAIEPLLERLTVLSTAPSRQERKIATVLFADISGFTALSENMDVEDVTDLMNAMWQRLDTSINNNGGYIDKHIGDAVMAIWGAKTSHEDDPERCIRAAIEMQSELEDFRIGCGLDLAMRIGINSGPVLLGEIGTTAEYTAIGDAVNTASRLEQAAPVGGVLISHATYQHVRGVFDVQPRREIRVKGKKESLRVYSVIQAKPRAFRVRGRGIEGIETRMVGRDAELSVLKDSLYIVLEDGMQQMVTILGDAGVGKSRLLYEFENWLELLPEQFLFFKGRARLETQGIPYGLLRDIFSFRFEIPDDDSPSTAWKKLFNGLREALFGMSSKDDGTKEMKAHFIGELLGFHIPNSPHLQAVLGDSQQIRDRASLYIADYFMAIAGEMPAIIFLEDLHWTDESSLDLLVYLSRILRDHRILFVALSRHDLLERRPNWGKAQSYHRSVKLKPLSESDCRLFFDEVLQKAEVIPEALRELVVSNAEGIPFYVEELVKMLIEDSVIIAGESQWRVHQDRLQDLHLPDTLAGVLRARLDSLPYMERAVLQQASVVGRVFWDRAVTYINTKGKGGLISEDVQNALDDLRRRELVFRSRTSAFARASEYAFKHALLREATYESVLKRIRRRYHGFVADWLIRQVGGQTIEITSDPTIRQAWVDEIKEKPADLLAFHFLRAGEWKEAWIYNIQAGRKAAERYANLEAIKYFQAAIDSAKQLPELEPTDRAESHMLMSEVLRRVNRYSEAMLELERALEISSELESSSPNRITQAMLRRRIGAVFISMGEYSKAIEVIRQGLQYLPDEQTLEGGALKLALASALTRQGLLKEAERWCRDGIDLVEVSGHSTQLAHAFNLLGTIRRDLGDTRASLEYRQRSLEIGKAIKHLPSQVEAHNNLAVAYYDLGHLQSAITHYEKSRGLSERIGNLNTTARAGYNLAEVQLILGDWGEAERSIHHAMDIWRTTGYLFGQAFGLCTLGDILTRKGNTEEAFNHLRKGQELLNELGARSILPYVYRLQAAAHLAERNLNTAEEYCHQSLNLARELSLPMEEGEALLILGKICAEQDLSIKARKHLEKSLEIFGNAKVQYGEARTLSELASLLLTSDELEVVATALDRAIVIFETMGAKVDLQRAKSIRSKLTE